MDDGADDTELPADEREKFSTQLGEVEQVRTQTSILAEFLATTGPEDIFHPGRSLSKKKSTKALDFLRSKRSTNSAQKHKTPKHAMIDPRTTREGSHYLAIKSDAADGSKSSTDPRSTDGSAGRFGSSLASFLPLSSRPRGSARHCAPSTQYVSDRSNEHYDRSPVFKQETQLSKHDISVSPTISWATSSHQRPSISTFNGSSECEVEAQSDKDRRASSGHRPEAVSSRPASGMISPLEASMSDLIVAERTSQPKGRRSRGSLVRTSQEIQSDLLSSEPSLVQSLHVLRMLSGQEQDEHSRHLTGDDHEPSNTHLTVGQGNRSKSKPYASPVPEGIPDAVHSSLPTSLTGRLRQAAASRSLDQASEHLARHPDEGDGSVVRSSISSSYSGVLEYSIGDGSDNVPVLLFQEHQTLKPEPNVLNKPLPTGCRSMPRTRVAMHDDDGLEARLLSLEERNRTLEQALMSLMAERTVEK